MKAAAANAALWQVTRERDALKRDHDTLFAELGSIVLDHHKLLGAYTKLAQENHEAESALRVCAEAFVGNTCGYPLDYGAAADPCGVVLYFDTPEAAGRFLDVSGTIGRLYGDDDASADAERRAAERRKPGRRRATEVARMMVAGEVVRRPERRVVAERRVSPW